MAFARFHQHIIGFAGHFIAAMDFPAQFSGKGYPEEHDIMGIDRSALNGKPRQISIGR